jgi:hypothetical protein
VFFESHGRSKTRNAENELKDGDGLLVLPEWLGSGCCVGCSPKPKLNPMQEVRKVSGRILGRLHRCARQAMGGSEPDRALKIH